MTDDIVVKTLYLKIKRLRDVFAVNSDQYKYLNSILGGNVFSKDALSFLEGLLSINGIDDTLRMFIEGIIFDVRTIMLKLREVQLKKMALNDKLNKINDEYKMRGLTGNFAISSCDKLTRLSEINSYLTVLDKDNVIFDEILNSLPPLVLEEEEEGESLASIYGLEDKDKNKDDELNESKKVKGIKKSKAVEYDKFDDEDVIDEDYDDEEAYSYDGLTNVFHKIAPDVIFIILVIVIIAVAILIASGIFNSLK